MPTLRAYVPDQLLADGALHGRAALTVQDGVVVAIGAPPPGAEGIPLPGRILVPGLVSAHGQTALRAVRGRRSARARGGEAAGGRGALSGLGALARRLDPDRLEAIARFAFFELARAGVTCAGELLVPHPASGEPPRAGLDAIGLRLARAARAVGLRVVLLAEAGGGAGEIPPAEALAALDRLRAALAGEPLATAGLAVVDLAGSAAGIEPLAEAARTRGVPLHVHAAVRAADAEACRAAHGASPVGLLERAGALGPGTTLVHAAALSGEDIAALGEARATVCALPLTARHAGLGAVPADLLLAAGARVALGAGDHAEVDLLGEARALELHLRLLRGVPAALDDPPGTLPGKLLQAASAAGMGALGLAGGRLAPGDPADFVLLDADDPSLAGADDPDALLASLALGSSPAAVKSTFVAGEPILEDGWTTPGRPSGASLLGDFREAMAGIWGAA